MRLLKRFLPKEDAFFDLFEAHSRETVAASVDLQSGLRSKGDANLASVVAHEEAADAVTREVLLAVRKSFITPFDRGAIKDLITAMDDSIDEMNKTVAAIALFELRDFSPEMQGMTDHIVSAAGLIDTALPMLRHVGSKATDIIAIAGKVVEIEGHADRVHRAGIKAFWDVRNGIPLTGPTKHEIDMMHGGLERYIVGKDVLDSLEAVMDRLEDVADVLHGIVIEHV